MNYLLDTCVISELIKAKPNKQVVNWINTQDETNLYLSILTIGEIKKGIAKLSNHNKKNKLDLWLNNELVSRFKYRILDINVEVVNKWGNLLARRELQGRPMPAIDSLIVATATANDCVLATRNIEDMQDDNVVLINPWEVKNESI